MDQGKLSLIRTHSQIFTNNPNEKFLLMILCSQAKLENDNRGINVKRGLKSKCQVGIRPALAPLGYLNVMKQNRIHTVILDPERSPIIRDMFIAVADQGLSGRTIRKWFHKIEFKTRNDKTPALGRIYETLKNPFYYGEFKFGEKWYKGTHHPLISKKIFDKVQIQLTVEPRQWNKQLFPFKKLCKCGGCGGSVTAQVKYRTTKEGEVHTHIYYHCNRIKDYSCKEPYITELELIKQLVALLPQIRLDTKFLWKEFKEEIKRLNHLESIMIRKEKRQLTQTEHNTGSKEIKTISTSEKEMIQDYLLHILQYGTPEERMKILKGIKTLFQLKQRELFITHF